MRSQISIAYSSDGNNCPIQKMAILVKPFSGPSTKYIKEPKIEIKLSKKAKKTMTFCLVSNKDLIFV